MNQRKVLHMYYIRIYQLNNTKVHMPDHVACWLAIVLKCLLGRRSVEERGRLVTGLVRLPLLSHSMIADLSYVWPSEEVGRSKVCLEGEHIR